MREIAAAIKTDLETITAIRQVFAPYELPDTPNALPAAIIMPGITDYNHDFTRQIAPSTSFRIIILLAQQSKPSAASVLVDLIEGDSSVFAVLEADPTLGDTCTGFELQRNKGLGVIPWGGIVYLSTEFEMVAYGIQD
ncbi:MAG: hypothetical protein P3T54_00190 [Dehalogenimonas sp.]|nr:hypothetical protein [Dehalogenimonas sp.]